MTIHPASQPASHPSIPPANLEPLSAALPAAAEAPVHRQVRCQVHAKVGIDARSPSGHVHFRFGRVVVVVVGSGPFDGARRYVHS